MKIITGLKQCTLTALVVGFVGTAFAQSPPEPTAEQLVANATYEQYLNDVEYVGNNRYAVIAGIMALWESQMGSEDGWEAEFTAALNRAADTQLLNIQNAASYDAVRAILQGRSAPASLEGVTGTEDLGDLTRDLVYTPVVPCRIFDTRHAIPASPPQGGNPGTVRNYYVYGNNALLAPQGHTAGTGCASPGGEPVAIAANFTVVPYGKGHIRVWPFGSTEPTASFLNYNSTVNSNLANAGIIATCYLCSRDLNVSTWYGSSDSLADVMGYFYPAEEVSNARTATSQSAVKSDSTCNYVASLLVTIPPGGAYVEVEADVNLFSSSTTEEFASMFLDRSSTTCLPMSISEGYIHSFTEFGESVDNYERVSLSRIFFESGTGAYRNVVYYVNTSGTDSGTNDDVYPYFIGIQSDVRPN